MAIESKRIPQSKVELVQTLKELIDKYNIICMAKMDKLGASQLQDIRRKLRGKINIRMTKNRYIQIAAAQSQKPNIKDFSEEIQGSTSFIFTDMSPFKLKLFLDENKVKAPAKAGDHAAKDIIVPEGNTGFPPGAVMSELKQVGIETMVKGGTIHIKKETLVVKKGDEITRQVALVLSRLNLNPMEIGLNLYAAYDNGLILKESDLKISIKDTLTQVQTAFTNALKISLKIAYPTKQNITMLIQKAILESKSLVLSTGIITKETISETLVKGYATAMSLISMIRKVNPNALPQDLEEKAEQIGTPEVLPSKEEKKEEPKEEKKGKPKEEKKGKPKEEKKGKPKEEKKGKPKEEKKKK